MLIANAKIFNFYRIEAANCRVSDTDSNCEAIHGGFKAQGGDAQKALAILPSLLPIAAKKPSAMVFLQ